MKCGSCGKESIGNTTVCVHCGALMGGVISSVVGHSPTTKPSALQPRIPAMQSSVSQAIGVPEPMGSGIWPYVSAILVCIILFAVIIVMRENGSESKAEVREMNGGRDHSYTAQDEWTCAVIRLELTEDQPAGMSREEFRAWAAKEISHCRDLGLLEEGK